MCRAGDPDRAGRHAARPARLIAGLLDQPQDLDAVLAAARPRPSHLVQERRFGVLRRVVAGARNTRFLRLVEHHNLCDEVLDAAQVRGSQKAGFAEAPVHKHVLNGHVQLIASENEAIKIGRAHV